MTLIQNKLWGSIVGGAIGDVLGGEFENHEILPKDSSIFGQIAGTAIGYSELPQKWIDLAKGVGGFKHIKQILAEYLNLL